jgi:hypothetical protein
MSLSSSIACDVCGKRGGERISDWFEVEMGSESLSVFHHSECSAGIARTSKDICGSRCLCVALERWVNKQLRLARAAAAAAAGDLSKAEPARTGPHIGSPSLPIVVRETRNRGQSKASKSALPSKGTVSGEAPRILEVFRKAVNR